MRLIGQSHLNPLIQSGEFAARWVAAWTAEVKSAHWKKPADILVQFPRVGRTADGEFLFPVARCAFAVEVLIAFPQGIALITSLKVIEVANGS